MQDLNKHTIVAMVIMPLLTALITGAYYYQWSFLWSVLILVIWVVMLVLGSMNIGWNYYLRALHRGKTRDKQVAITFDDGPDETQLPELLSVLKAYHARATFFLIGNRVAANAALIRQIHKEGHLLGNHSYYHRWSFPILGYDRTLRELLMTSEAVYKVTGMKPRLFRPPFGVTNPTIARAVSRLGLTTVGWSLRTFDTARTPEQVEKTLRRQTRPGAIVLMHDSVKNVVPVTKTYLEWLAQQGYRVVPLDQILAIEPYE